MKWPRELFKAQFIIFRCQKYVKKGYMEMRKWIYLAPLKNVLSRSILDYCLLRQVNGKWRNPSYQSKFFNWSDTKIRNPHTKAFISKNVYSHLWKTLLQLFVFTISVVPLTPARKREYTEYLFTKFHNF